MRTAHNLNLPAGNVFRRLCHHAGALLPGLVLLLLVMGSESAVRSDEIDDLHQQCHRLIVDETKLLEARPLVEKLVELCLEKRGEVHLDTIRAFHWQAFLLQCFGQVSEACRIWERSLAIQEKSPTEDPIWLPRTLNMLAGAYQEEFEFSRAEACLRRALEIRKRVLGAKHGETGSLLHSLGRLQLQRGDSAQAEATLLSTLKIHEEEHKARKDRASLVSDLLATLGGVYVDIWDLDKAEDFYRRELAFNLEFFGERHARYCKSMYQMAQICCFRRDPAGAAGFLAKGMAVMEQLAGTNGIPLSHPLGQLAETYRSMGDYTNGHKTVDRAISLVQSHLGVSSLRLADLLITKAGLCQAEGDHRRAIEIRQEALALLERQPEFETRRMVELRREIALLRFSESGVEATPIETERIQDDEERVLSNLLSFTSERQRLSFLSEWTPSDRYNLWANTGAARPLARAVLRTKGLVLDTIAEDRRLAEASGDTELRRKREQLFGIKRRLAQLMPNDFFVETEPSEPTNHRKEKIRLLNDRLEMLESDLTRSVQGLGNARKALTVTLEQVQRAIPPSAAVIEFILYEQYSGSGAREGHYGALIFRSSGEPVWRPLASAAVIDKNIKLYQHLVRSRSDDALLTDLLSRFYQQLWAPLSNALPPEIKHVILSPDAQLNFVSFATLVSKRGRFVGEDYRISYVGTSRDLLARHEEPPAHRTLHIWANPSFGQQNGTPRDDASAQVGSSQWEPVMRSIDFKNLAGAVAEGAALQREAKAAGFAETFLLVGTNATETALAKLRSPTVVHLATHGFVLPEVEITPSQTSAHAMMRSGLALAGARRTLDAWAKGQFPESEDDGIATAEEIACLNLRGTWLVVLSACDTGLGEGRAGEGVLGLRRGFTYAGAQNMLLTLWPIDDKLTSEFMPEFYRVALSNGDPAGALALGQRKWLARLRTESGIAQACRIAGPFILSFQSSPSRVLH